MVKIALLAAWEPCHNQGCRGYGYSADIRTDADTDMISISVEYPQRFLRIFCGYSTEIYGYFAEICGYSAKICEFSV